MENTILLVEDEFKMRKLIKDYLKRESFTIIDVDNGDSAIQEFKSYSSKISLVILDIMIPGSDGYTVCEEIREISNVPIMLLTAKSEDEDKLLGYELGADEYVTKPFSPKVLMAQVKALLKRSSQNINDNINKEIIINDLKIDINKKAAYVNDSKLSLSPREYDLLEFLMKNKNIVLSRDALLNNVWGYDYFGDARTVDTHIKRLREKLDTYSYLVKTVRRKGYMLSNEVN